MIFRLMLYPSVYKWVECRFIAVMSIKIQITDGDGYSALEQIFIDDRLKQSLLE